MPVFKDYYGNIIEVSDHTHLVSDTKNGDNVAYATESDHGFMVKEDVQKLQDLSNQLDSIDDLMENIVYKE